MTGEESISGDCKLCGNFGVLRESHILPKHAYKQAIKHAQHPRTLIVRDLPAGTAIDRGRQDGFKERMLCDACEQKLSKWETYACSKLFNYTLPAPNAVTSQIELTGIRYEPMKLYLLSLLWRAGVADSDFCKSVRLGPHGERLRKMLVAEHPGESTDYGCLILKLEQWKEYPLDGVVFEPFSIRNDGENGAMFAFMGLGFNFFITARKAPLGVTKSFLDRTGSLRITPVRIDRVSALFPFWTKMITAVQEHDE